MMSFKKCILSLLFGIVLLLAQPAKADQLIKTVNDWLIMKSQPEGNKQHCYLATMPYRTKAYKGNKKREPRLIIVYLGQSQYTLSVDVDYNIDRKQNIMLSVNETTRELQSQYDSNSAHTFSSVQDVALINDFIKAEDYFTITSFDDDNNYALDYYSLKGFNKAIKLMSKICK